MARTIANIVDFIQYVCRKERGIFINPAQCTTNLDAAQLDCLEDWFKPYGQTQQIHDALRNLRVYYQFTTDAAGFITYPSDYLHIIGSAFTVTGSTVNEVTMVNEDEFANALKSQLRPVSLSRPLGRDTATGVSLYPQSVQIGFFSYLKRPPTPVYAYSQVGRTIAYDAANSTQLIWSDAYINNIIARSLFYVGINMDEKGISDFANEYNNETKQ